MLEDDIILSDILSHHLRDSGYEVVHVEDGESALENASGGKFDMMIFDINVPKRVVLLF